MKKFLRLAGYITQSGRVDKREILIDIAVIATVVLLATTVISYADAEVKSSMPLFKYADKDKR